MSNADDWPPPAGLTYIRSEAFGELLVGIAEEYAEQYPRMDFTDAVASVFAWFDQKLAINRRFINARRFPNRARFAAYLRVAVWNVGRQAERRRRRHGEIEALPENEPIAPATQVVHELDRVLAAVSRLEEPHRTVVHRVIFEHEEFDWIASCLDKTEDEITAIYIEALDQLASLLSD